MFFRKSDIKIKSAYIISRISEPFLMLGIFGLTVMFSDYMSGESKFFWGALTVFFLGILPLATLWLGVKKIKKIDIDFTKRESRTPFILIILFYWVLGLVLFWALQAPEIVVNVLLISIMINFLVLLINFYWKISNHSLTITVLAFFINELFGWNYWWLFLFVPIVCWARWVQKKHTVGQLSGGIGMAVIAWLMLRWIGY